MRLSALAAGLFLFAILYANDNPSVYANQADQSDVIKNISTVGAIDLPDPRSAPKTEAPEAPKPTEYIAVDNDNLSKIAEAHATSWQRLFAKNTNIENPDVIKTGEKIIIPLPDEVLPERAVPAAAPTTETAASNNYRRTGSNNSAAQSSVARGGSSGNTYAPGWCTYYAKQRRPDLPNNLGNADTWVARAAGQGIPTGSAPRAGAIGQQGMHVVYIESVNGDGTVTVSEMNYAGFGVVSSRTVAASNFQYIY